jgi:hypothetical protein
MVIIYLTKHNSSCIVVFARKTRAATIYAGSLERAKIGDKKVKNTKFNNSGDEVCNEGQGHDFSGGLCQHCLCPETAADQVRAENALYNAEALEGRYSEVLGYTPTREQAIFEAWRSHKRQNKGKSFPTDGESFYLYLPDSGESIEVVSLGRVEGEEGKHIIQYPNGEKQTVGGYWLGRTRAEAKQAYNETAEEV